MTGLNYKLVTLALVKSLLQITPGYRQSSECW